MRVPASLAPRLVDRFVERRAWQAMSVRVGLLLLLCLCGGTCGSKGLLAPFLEVAVMNLPPGATQLQVDATYAGKTQTDVGGNTMLDRFTISLPSDARGKIDVQVTARDANNCIVAIGQLSQDLVDNVLYQVTLMMSAQTPPICPGGAMVPITLTKKGGGGGNITATQAALSCDTACSSKMANFDAGTIISLSVDTLTTAPGWSSSFDGWSGACTGTTTCIITLAQATTITANFTCHGWCPESLPTETNNLNGVWAFNAQRIVAVGDGGRILQWDGTSWNRISSPVTANLRRVHGIGTGIGFAVGDTGTILKTTDDGTTWVTMNSTTTRNLRGVWALDGSEVYAVGDNLAANTPWLQSDGNTWSSVSRSGADVAWNAVWGYASVNFVVVGDQGKSAQNNPFSIPAAVTASPLNGLFGTSSTTLTAVGVGGTILRYSAGTPGTWSTMSAPSGTAFPTLHAIHGSAANEMFTVGDSGTVWSYNGSVWNIDSFPVQTQLNGVYVFSPTEVYVVGAGGLIYHKKM